MERRGIKAVLSACLLILAMGLGACGKEFKTVEEYAQSQEVQQSVAAISGDGVSVSVSGEGNKLIYTYTYEEIEKQDGMAEQLEAALKEKEDEFTDVADAIKLVCDEENPVVVVEYTDCNGEKIYSQEYSAREKQ